MSKKVCSCQAVPQHNQLRFCCRKLTVCTLASSSNEIVLTSLIVIERSLYADSLIKGPLSVVVVNSRRPRSSCRLQTCLHTWFESLFTMKYPGNQVPSVACITMTGRAQKNLQKKASSTCQTLAVLEVCTAPLPGIGV